MQIPTLSLEMTDLIRPNGETMFVIHFRGSQLEEHIGEAATRIRNMRPQTVTVEENESTRELTVSYADGYDPERFKRAIRASLGQLNGAIQREKIKSEATAKEPDAPEMDDDDDVDVDVEIGDYRNFDDRPSHSSLVDNMHTCAHYVTEELTLRFTELLAPLALGRRDSSNHTRLDSEIHIGPISLKLGFTHDRG